MPASERHGGLTVQVRHATGISQVVAGENTRDHLASIQVIRGAAAVLVLLYHSGTLYAVKTDHLLFANLFRTGFVGVDIFFVLSGFIICWLHADDVGKPEKVVTYLKKRFARVIPLYWAVVLAKAIKDGGAVSVGTLMFAAFLLPYPLPPYINVAWTLTFEAAFYLAFAAAIVLPRGYLTFVPIAALMGLGIAPHPYSSPASPLQIMANFMFDDHVMEFLFGIGACIAAPKLSKAGARTTFNLGMLLAVGFFVTAGALSFDPKVGQSMGDAYRLAETETNVILHNKLLLLALPISMMLCGATALERSGSVSALYRLAWIGDVSYALYLSHGFVVYFALSWKPFQAVATYAPASMFAVMLLCLLVARLVHTFVEKPLNGAARRLLKISR